MIFRPKPNVEPLTIIKMIQAQPRVYALDGQDKLRFKMPLEGTAERLRATNELLSSLSARKAAESLPHSEGCSSVSGTKHSSWHDSIYGQAMATSVKPATNNAT